MEGELPQVACVLQQKKLKSVAFEALAKRAASHGLQLVPVSLEQSLSDQGRFCAVMHKATTCMALAEEGCPMSIRQLQRLTSYLRTHRHVRMIDPLADVRILSSRALTYDVMRSCTLWHTAPRLLAPAFVVVNHAESAAATVADAGLRFPIVCKSVAAHGTHAAHEMHIVFNPHALASLQPPYIAQQFVNHDAVIFKVFVIDEHFAVVARPSIRNLTACTSTETIRFHSHDVSKATSTSFLNKAGAVDSAAVSVDENVIKEAVHVLRQRLGLALFGFDVIVDPASFDMYMVDINYFPGYHGMDGFHDVLLSYISRVVYGAATGALSGAAAAAAAARPRRRHDEDALSTSSESDAEAHASSSSADSPR